MKSIFAGHWENPEAAASVQQMGYWTGDPQDGSGWQHTTHLSHQPAAIYSHHQQFVPIPAYQEPPSNNPAMMIHQPTEYIPIHHQSHHQAMTQITHATQHAMPIMATHATQHYVTPKDNNYYGRGFSRPPVNSSSSGGSRSSNWRENKFPDKEVTRIPPRFQKQRPLHQHSAASDKPSAKPFSNVNLPRATSRTAPTSANRLTIFGTSNVVNNLDESFVSDNLSIPVRLIPAMKLEVFKEKIGMVDPEKDRLVLVHGLGNDARNIALKEHKSDVDKGAESDNLAKEFSEIIIDLIERIPYVKVLISTLLPRFDNEEQLNMSNPNNVRKVMNVEISMRLQDKPNVEFINNDTVLEWWKDEVKKVRLFGKDGYHLSAYGFSMMFEYWMKSLKKSVTDLGLVDGELLFKFFLMFKILGRVRLLFVIARQQILRIVLSHRSF